MFALTHGIFMLRDKMWLPHFDQMNRFNCVLNLKNSEELGIWKACLSIHRLQKTWEGWQWRKVLEKYPWWGRAAYRVEVRMAMLKKVLSEQLHLLKVSLFKKAVWIMKEWEIHSTLLQFLIDCKMMPSLMCLWETLTLWVPLCFKPNVHLVRLCVKERGNISRKKDVKQCKTGNEKQCKHKKKSTLIFMQRYLTYTF